MSCSTLLLGWLVREVHKWVTGTFVADDSYYFRARLVEFLSVQITNSNSASVIRYYIKYSLQMFPLNSFLLRYNNFTYDIYISLLHSFISTSILDFNFVLLVLWIHMCVVFGLSNSTRVGAWTLVPTMVSFRVVLSIPLFGQGSIYVFTYRELLQ